MSPGVLGRRDDGRDALMAAALGARTDALQAWRRWEAAGVDVDRDRVAFRWLPLVAANLRGAPTARARERLWGAAHGAWAFNRRALTAASSVVAHLELAGIRALVLKGAALEVRNGAAWGGRAIGDVDLLVSPDAFEDARALLGDLGWHPGRSNRRPLDPWRHSVDFTRADDVAIDLHRFLLAECCWPGADAAVWQQAQTVVSDDRVWLTPGAEDLLLQVCVHGLRWSPVHAGTWVADAAAILARDGTRFDWTRLIEEARRRSLTTQVRDALAMVQRAADVGVPVGAMAALTRGRVSWRDRLEEYAKVRPILGTAGLIATWCGWQRFGARTGRRPGLLAYAASLAGVPSRRQLIPWAWRHVRRRAAARGGDPWGLGLSSRPALPSDPER